MVSDFAETLQRGSGLRFDLRSVVEPHPSPQPAQAGHSSALVGGVSASFAAASMRGPTLNLRVDRIGRWRCFHQRCYGRGQRVGKLDRLRPARADQPQGIFWAEILGEVPDLFWQPIFVAEFLPLCESPEWRLS